MEPPELELELELEEDVLPDDELEEVEPLLEPLELLEVLDELDFPLLPLDFPLLPLDVPPEDDAATAPMASSGDSSSSPGIVPCAHASAVSEAKRVADIAAKVRVFGFMPTLCCIGPPRHSGAPSDFMPLHRPRTPVRAAPAWRERSDGELHQTIRPSKSNSCVEDVNVE